MTASLVVAPQWIGDAVMCEPLLAALSARGERLTVAALPSVAPVFRAMPDVAEVIELPFVRGRLDWTSRRRLAAGLRGRFEIAYVLPNSFKSALLPWLARIPRRVGYVGEARVGLLNERHPNPRGRPPMAAHYAALAGRRSGSDAVPVEGPGAFDARPSPRLRIEPARVDAVLGAYGLVRGAYWAFAPGAEYGPAKRWPEPRYAELAASFHRRDAAPVVLLGAPAEAASCRAIAAASPPGTCRVLAGRASLDDAMAIVAGARGVVSNDSGLMHVAAALDVPQVAVFGSTSPLHTPPASARARVIWLKRELGLDCMPCFERTCRYGHYRCLTSVDAARVEAAMDDALSPTA